MPVHQIESMKTQETRSDSKKRRTLMSFLDSEFYRPFSAGFALGSLIVVLQFITGMTGLAAV